MPRTIASGGIRGCCTVLAKLIVVVAPQAGNTVVPLGDCVDQVLDSRGVIDRLIRDAGIWSVPPE